MSRTIYTFNSFHLGDNLIFLHLLRSLAKQHDQTPFVHFCNGCDLPQLLEVVADLPNIILTDFESVLWQEHHHETIDTWKNHNRFWENSHNRWDWSQFMLSHHAWTAQRMGFDSHFEMREHLLFDYPALETKGTHQFDFLIGDSPPSSGQYSEWADHSKEPLRPLIEALLNQKKFRVLLTSSARDSGQTISAVGRVSQRCMHHIMVPNGPFWPTLSTHNHHWGESGKHIVLLDNGEKLNMPHIIQMSSVDDVMRFAKEEGWV